jgi:hypothetical protein
MAGQSSDYDEQCVLIHFLLDRARSVRAFWLSAMPMPLARWRWKVFKAAGPVKNANIEPRLSGGACHTSM